MARPVVFLDLDGVLNHSTLEQELQKSWSDTPTPDEQAFLSLWQEDFWVSWLPRQERTIRRVLIAMRFVDPKAVALLVDLVERVDADIVISSDWRKRYSLEGLRVLLGRVGINPARIVDVTPVLFHRERGQEVWRWLEDHPSYREAVILDDRSDMEPLRPLLIRTSDKEGLQQEHIHDALTVLWRQSLPSIAPLGLRSIVRLPSP